MLIGALEGVKVLDLSEDIAGSFCSRLLADYGADVLKVEPPGGAALRRLGPFFHDEPHPEKSLFNLVLNLNKKGATLNLETVSGRNILKRLVPHVDVIVESFRPGYLASLGMGYDDLAALNPALAMTSITPFGQEGPYSQYRGEEIVNYAMGMIMSISGVQGREPLKHGGFQAQYEGGLFAAAATSMALFGSDFTGQGEHIDVSITECIASTMMATQTMYPFMGGTQVRRRAQRQHVRPPHALPGRVDYRANRRRRFLGGSSRVFPSVPKCLEERFADRAQRAVNGEELDRIVIESIKERSKWELFPKAAEYRMLFGLVQTPSELVDCPQLESRNFFREIEHPVMGKVKVPAELFKLSETPYRLERSAPTLGQHNREIYVDGLEYDDRQFTQLRQLNVI